MNNSHAGLPSVDCDDGVTCDCQRRIEDGLLCDGLKSSAMLLGSIVGYVTNLFDHSDDGRRCRMYVWAHRKEFDYPSLGWSTFLVQEVSISD